ncbi:hypothetical protein HPP92_003872 [Vanilla planifolia]|uniref:Uncharacterized protein n=1 Tax=Vanilla planifolia TaxID=51239 RepID=A0A835RZ88_VANPL|nr:hypothetical protein HPP92_004324 [Vanilla planifolia]KAG0503800.1 hypothetical protein HPP92_003872 [Vanilla planifolia]
MWMSTWTERARPRDSYMAGGTRGIWTHGRKGGLRLPACQPSDRQPAPWSGIRKGGRDVGGGRRGDFTCDDFDLAEPTWPANCLRRCQRQSFACM